MEVRITTLIENNSDEQEQLHYEHGLSMLVETGGKRLLFDTGQSGDFIKNANTLKVELNNLDYVVISHSHYDHGGGFASLIEEYDKNFTLVVGEEFFKLKYKELPEGSYKHIGISFSEEMIKENGVTLKKVTESMVFLTDHIIVFHHFSCCNDYEMNNPRFYIKENSIYQPDFFDDEVALAIVTRKGLVVIAGCAHVGIVNILDTISKLTNLPIHAVIGGTHLIEASDERITKTLDYLKKQDIKLVAVSHCTGENATKRIQSELKERFLYNNTGTMIEI